ncbi:MAG TPA: CdaR family protein [Vicinamibacterales bacterium]|nr:CdaR family protein [Vicinamibacterales bacterium]
MRFNPFQHLWLKVLALLLASVLWLTVAGEHVVERSMRVPLELRNVPPQLEIVGDPPMTVDVRVRGSSAVLGRMDPGDVVAILDLDGARSGSRLFHLRADEVKGPYGVEVAQLTPATIALELEKSARRSVPVIAAVEGDPAPGFVTGRSTVTPPTVEVLGPESRLRDLTSATTEPVSVSGQRANVTDVVTIGVLDSALRLAETQTATVSVEILPAPVEREFSGVPIRWRNLGAGLSARVQPSVTRVTVRGRRPALDSIRTETFDAFVDLAGLGPGQYNLRVQIDPTQNFGVSSTDPDVVHVIIK